MRPACLPLACLGHGARPCRAAACPGAISARMQPGCTRKASAARAVRRRAHGFCHGCVTQPTLYSHAAAAGQASRRLHEPQRTVSVSRNPAACDIVRLFPGTANTRAYRWATTPWGGLRQANSAGRNNGRLEPRPPPCRSRVAWWGSSPDALGHRRHTNHRRERLRRTPCCWLLAGVPSVRQGAA